MIHNSHFIVRHHHVQRRVSFPLIIRNPLFIEPKVIARPHPQTQTRRRNFLMVNEPFVRKGVLLCDAPMENWHLIVACMWDDLLHFVAGARHLGIHIDIQWKVGMSHNFGPVGFCLVKSFKLNVQYRSWPQLLDGNNNFQSIYLVLKSASKICQLLLLRPLLLHIIVPNFNNDFGY